MMSSGDVPKPEVVKQEEEYLRKVHPNPEDVPGCMKLFDDFLMCNGAMPCLAASVVMCAHEGPYLHSDRIPTEVAAAVIRPTVSAAGVVRSIIAAVIGVATAAVRGRCRCCY